MNRPSPPSSSSSHETISKRPALQKVDRYGQKIDTGPREGDCGLLETENVTGAKPKKLWVVRITNEVADALDAAEPGAELGTVTFNGKGPNATKTVELYPYSAPGRVGGDLAPTEFELVGGSSSSGDANGGLYGFSVNVDACVHRGLYGFSVNVDRSHVRLEGTVSHQYSLRPKRGNQYEEFTRARNQAAQQKSSGKRILTLDDSDAAAAGARAAPFVPTAMFRAVQAAKATTASGAGSSSSGGSHQREGRITEEMDPQELRLKLFALFAENDKLWIQDLKTQLEVPEPQLRALLRDYCTKEKVGARMYYTLNADYRT